MQANQAHYRRVPQLGSTGHAEELRLAGTDAGAGATTPPTSTWWRSCCPALCARRVVLDLCGNAAAADWGDRDSPFGELPDEVLERIWSRLDHRSLALGAALVCRRWAELVARETVWCQLCLWHARGAHPAPSWLLSLAEAHTDPRDPVELPEHLADRSWKEFCERGAALRAVRRQDSTEPVRVAQTDGRWSERMRQEHVYAPFRRKHV